MLTVTNHQGLLVFEKKGRVSFLWRAAGRTTPGIFCVESADGKVFKKQGGLVTFFTADGIKTMLGATPDLRASMFGTKTVLTFVDQKKQLVFADSGRNGSWKTLSTTTLFQGPTVGVKVPAKKNKKATIIVFSRRNSRVLFEAKTTDENFKRFRDSGDVLTARRTYFDATALTPLSTQLVRQGILLIYTAKDSRGKLGVGAALFNHDDPQEMVWRSDHSLWEAPKHLSSEATILGGVNRGKYFYLFVQNPGQAVECFPMARHWEAVEKDQQQEIVLPPRKKGVRITLERSVANPVLEPITQNAWEAFATFNPAALSLDGRVHLLYRAQGYDGLSVLGYAGSSDGIHIDERHSEPAFVPSRAFDRRRKSADQYPYPYVSGGGAGGCEDPRLVEIAGFIYLIYVAFDGAHPPGVALSYISKGNFLAKRWCWARPKLISKPGQIQKNWVLFPEKIHGKYAVLHGLSPEIRIEYINDPKKLGDGKYIESLSSHGGRGYVETARLHAWDNIVRGVGAPPLKTAYGWLVFYHGMDMRDPGKYKVGVMLLDLNHPERILCRSAEPVLEPETIYENSGHKRGVIYVCGAVVKDEKLFVYYGAADHTSAVATAHLETFLQALLNQQTPRLKKENLKKIS